MFVMKFLKGLGKNQPTKQSGAKHVTQMVGHQLSKHEALSSNPSTSFLTPHKTVKFYIAVRCFNVHCFIILPFFKEDKQI
jgi:hypothetical protein